MSDTITTGGCACGAIRYEFTGKPLAVFNCHCHSCRKSSGSAFITGAVVPKPDFKFTKGSPVYHTMKGDSGKDIRRGHCALCGTHISALLENNTGIVSVHVGSLDTPAAFKPQLDFYTAHALPWVQISDDTKIFSGPMTH